MTRTFKKCNVEITSSRTTERVTVLSADRSKIVTRNIWVGDKGQKYVLYKGRFHEVSKSNYYAYEYVMW